MSSFRQILREWFASLRRIVSDSEAVLQRLSDGDVQGFGGFAESGFISIPMTPLILRRRN
jgi:hypothetical protein